MTELELPIKKSPQIRPWRYIPILIILGLAAYLLLPQIASLKSSWSVVQHMIWWAVVLAVISQVLSYFGNGYMLHAILDLEKQKLAIWKGTLITMGCIGLVAGGWVDGAAATTYFGMLRPPPSGGEEHSPEDGCGQGESVV